MKILPGYTTATIDTNTRKSIRKEIITGANQYLGICEQLRFIYDSVEQLPDSDIKEMIIEQLVDAYDMGKKMSARLVYYSKHFKDDTGHKGKNIIWLNRSRARLNIRRKRKV